MSMSMMHGCESSTGGQQGATRLCNHYCHSQRSAHDQAIQVHLAQFLSSLDSNTMLGERNKQGCRWREKSAHSMTTEA